MDSSSLSIFSVTLCYLITVFVSDKIPILSMSEKSISSIITIQIATIHSGVLWVPWLRQYFVKGTGLFPLILLLVFYCALVAYEFYSSRSNNFIVQAIFFATLFYDRIHNFRMASSPDHYATYIMCTSGVACFGGLLLFCILSFGLEDALGIRPSSLNPAINNGQFWFIVVVMPAYCLADYWLKGLLKYGGLFNLYDFVKK